MTIPTLSPRQAFAILDTYAASRSAGHATAFSIVLGVYRSWFPSVATVDAADEVSTLLATVPMAKAGVPYVFCE
jgi:hypothetical protein